MCSKADIGHGLLRVDTAHWRLSFKGVTNAFFARRGAKLAKLDTGECDKCSQAFHYELIHNG